MSELA